jgi:hypothetical protein
MMRQNAEKLHQINANFAHSKTPHIDSESNIDSFDDLLAFKHKQNQ